MGRTVPAGTSRDKASPPFIPQMSHIAEVLTVPVRAGFFADDQAAIRAGAPQEGFDYLGQPVTPGFTRIRQPGEALSVILALDDGYAALGDCATVQYSGACGRDAFLGVEEAAQVVHQEVAPLLLGRRVWGFRDLAGEVDELTVAGERLHSAIRYGVSQAILDAAAWSQRLTMAEVVRNEYRTGCPLEPVPLFAQSGDDRRSNLDKMILKEVEVLPHGLINSVETKLGRRGELLAEYVAWVRRRILELRRRPGYAPTLHFDTYGTIGLAFGGDIGSVAGYLARLNDLAAPFALRIEHPLDAGSRDAQVARLAELRSVLAARGVGVQIVADEWCNTLEDVREFVAAGAADVIHVKCPDLGSVHNAAAALLSVREAGLGAYCGGTCNETERSAQVCAHLAMACGASQVLAKPGMGVDEGLMIVGNEMARVAALARYRQRQQGGPEPAAAGAAQ
jgi:methylaspartate ammonia-lyase